MTHSMSIRRMVFEDIPEVAKVHAEAFVRQTLSKQWISCNFQAFPRIRYFVAEVDQNVVGYIHWTEKSGFRTEVILELEQIAVTPVMQNKKVGTALILQSLILVKKDLNSRGSVIKSVLISTRVDNDAQKLYMKTLGAEIIGVIPKVNQNFDSQNFLLTA